MMGAYGHAGLMPKHECGERFGQIAAATKIYRLIDGCCYWAELCSPFFSFKCARWPVQSTIAKEVQSLQKRMVTVMMGIRMLPHETPASFRRRRARLASTHMSSGICWARVWATRWRDWDRHLARHPEHAASKLLKSRDSAWLRARRWLFAPAASSARHAWTIAAGRTDTRVAAGAVQQRWAASTDEIMARWPDLLR